MNLIKYLEMKTGTGLDVLIQVSHIVKNKGKCFTHTESPTTHCAQKSDFQKTRTTNIMSLKTL